jgi:hypothetical protein
MLRNDTGFETCDTVADLIATATVFRPVTHTRTHVTGPQVRDLKCRLRSNNYSGVQEKRRRKLIDVQTTNMAVADLEKYWTALDKVQQLCCCSSPGAQAL